MTTAPDEDDAAERAEFWRLTQAALAKHPDALDEDRCGRWRSGTGSKTTDRTAAPPYRVTILMVTRSRT